MQQSGVLVDQDVEDVRRWSRWFRHAPAFYGDVMDKIYSDVIATKIEADRVSGCLRRRMFGVRPGSGPKR